MPRQARQKSETGIYHVMLRGINRQQIFEDEDDYRKFLDVAKECKDKSQFAIYAYCLMGNHVQCMDADSSNARIGDKEAAALINQTAKTSTPQEIQAYLPEEKKRILSELRSQGLSIRQISRLTGIGFSFVRKC